MDNYLKRHGWVKDEVDNGEFTLGMLWGVFKEFTETPLAIWTLRGIDGAKLDWKLIYKHADYKGER